MKRLIFSILLGVMMFASPSMAGEWIYTDSAHQRHKYQANVVELIDADGNPIMCVISVNIASGADKGGGLTCNFMLYNFIHHPEMFATGGGGTQNGGIVTINPKDLPTIGGKKKRR